MRKRDYIFIISAILTGLLLLFCIKFNAKNGNLVRITVDGKLFCEKPLYQNCEIKINDTNIAVIENNCVFMKEANCPDKLCVKTGKAADCSKKIVCLPNKVVIEITKKSDIDTVVK